MDNPSAKNRGEVSFDASYYERLIREHGYDPIRDNIHHINFSLGSLSPEDLSRMWICHSDGDIFAVAAKQREKVRVISGVGLSGVPHLGTLSQILKTIRIQRENIPVKFFLGDLDAYNGKGCSLPSTLDLAKQYKRFMIDLGFDPTSPNELEGQYDELQTLRTMYLTGHYIHDQDFTNTEEDLHAFYAKHGKVDEAMSYRRKLSLHLMVAGWYHQQLEHGEKNILVSLGIDEHQYVRFGQKVLSEMQRAGAFDGAFGGCHIAGIYSDLLRGFSGYPKMSKSFPESGITADMTRERIYRTIMSEKNDEGCERPEENVVYQAMSACSLMTMQQLRNAYVLCLRGGKEWQEAKEHYAVHLFEDILSKWPR